MRIPQWGLLAVALGAVVEMLPQLRGTIAPVPLHAGDEACDAFEDVRRRIGAMTRVYNFSAGPAVLPEAVLQEAAAEMLDYQGCGMSVMEMSHRSSAFKGIIDQAERDLRDLVGIPENYRVLFLQGGGSTQFAMVPMNLMRGIAVGGADGSVGHADYIVTGTWSKKALAEAQRFGDARCIATSADTNFDRVPDMTNIQVNADADYVYICMNETVNGNVLRELPDTQGKPLVADMSSCFLSEPIDVERYGLIFAGAQKNVGPAGVTIVIVREDLIPEGDLPGVPTMMQYRTHADARSLYNTPPCYAIYICGKVFKWLKSQGGLAGMQKTNQDKAALLYDYLDKSNLFRGFVRPQDRSLMNVTFTAGDELDAAFVAEAKARGFENLKGHRSVGGLRASIYNAMPVEGVQALVEFMREFEAHHSCSSQSI